jgi:hypothetical protein
VAEECVDICIRAELRGIRIRPAAERIRGHLLKPQAVKLLPRRLGETTAAAPAARDRVDGGEEVGWQGDVDPRVAQWIRPPACTIQEPIACQAFVLGLRRQPANGWNPFLVRSFRIGVVPVGL